MNVRENAVACVSFPRIALNLHLRNWPVVVHVSSSLPPLHTGASPGGESVTAPTFGNYQIDVATQ